MALQGTLETFSLPDVLQLLSSTKKSGCLRVTGDRGEGSVWLADGAIVATDLGGSSSPAATDAVFELLRYETGEFSFDDGGAPADAGEPVEVATALEDAGRMVEEWSAIERVVPSAEHHVTLAAALPGDEVTLTADRWRALVAVGGGSSVRDLGAALDLGELAVARLVVDLVEAGVVEVGEPRAAAPTPAASAAPAPAPAAETAPVVDPVVEPEPAAEPERFDPDALVVDDTSFAPPASPAFSVVPDDEPAPADEPVAAVAEPPSEPEPEPEPAATVPEPGEAAEIARQLANLSPKAARAVAAAAKATTPEERDAALAEVEASDEQINRDLLLKFLGSVN